MFGQTLINTGERFYLLIQDKISENMTHLMSLLALWGTKLIPFGVASGFAGNQVNPVWASAPKV